MLGSFAGSDPNGTWTLFLADLSSGAQSTVVSWGLDIITVPEPSTVAMGLMGLALLAGLRKIGWRRDAL
jgi:MYXO-CTERM domain-containing protein